ncbi:glycosyltransferase family 2 protein [Brachybacterium saurashtrense]|uniref:Glycosyltransferase n=1 Tax=Brachybacterium saurashtrense TaxID=556288 RepID=A0A345YK40_9MICO|nr:glycosyltransferase [Brachybacterium saurashtrense]AXK44292.1 glycosyltransferase [Brachybacterium saurashtrense]RRR21328.1 glycosyltransferase [Brachybacterium saurashtrense]RRR22903.1 glycosyltransferase [Brachybacterium saurashtrense]
MSTAGPLTAHRPERVAVVIPAKNEAERIEATIASARRLAGVDLVVVVDDGSTDATSAVAMGADALVVRHKTNRGKAAAMATGAQMVAIREDAERADGGEAFSEELHAEPRTPGHTGPLPVIAEGESQPRAMLFLDADMTDSAVAAQPLVDAVLHDGVDMAIALLPPQEGAAGMGVVVRTARRGIQRATGWEPVQPLSGTRCLTREAWEACQPLAPGWGVETSLTIDALTAGFWVKEIPASLRHRATGKDLRGQLHRAAQLRDVVRALARRRHLAPELEAAAVDGVEERSTLEAPEPEPAPLPAGADDHDEAKTWRVVPEPDAAQEAGRAEERRATLADLPVHGEFSDDETRALGDVDVAELDDRLRALPVEGDFAPDDVVFLVGTDLEALGERLRTAPVEGAFAPEHAVIIASHLEAGEPEIPVSVQRPLNPEEYTSLVVHAAVESENS